MTQVIVFEECSGFIFTQTGIFSSLKLTILLIHKTNEVKMCFICKPDATYIKFITINRCEHCVCKIQPLLHAFIMDVAWCHWILYGNMCRLFLIICWMLERLKIGLSYNSVNEFHPIFYLTIPETETKFSEVVIVCLQWPLPTSSSLKLPVFGICWRVWR